MLNKKLIIMIVFTLSLLLVSSSGLAEDVTKVVIWGGVPTESGPGAAVEKFNEIHPNIEAEYVRFVNTDAGNTKLETALLSGEQIDILFNYNRDRMAKRVEAGMIADLTALGAKEFIEENIVSYQAIPKFSGKYYGVPYANQPWYMAVNMDMFSEAEIEIPEEWTIEQFREIAKKLTVTKNGEKIYGAFPYLYEQLNPALKVLGYDYYYKKNSEPLKSNFDHSAFKHNKLSYNLIHVDESGYPYTKILTEKLTWRPFHTFLKEKTAIIPMQGHWMLKYFKDEENYPHDFKTAFVPFPVPDTSNTYYNQGGIDIDLSISNMSENKEAAWEFIKFWITEGTKEMYGSGKAPSYKYFDKDIFIDNLLGENAEQQFDLESFKKVTLNDDINYSVRSITVASSQIQDIRLALQDQLLLQEIDYEEFLEELKKQSDKAIKKALK